MDHRERKLLTAARGNDWQQVVQLLKAGTDPDTEGPFGPVIFMALLLGHTIVAKLLVEAGADLHVTDDEGRTPLHRAAIIEGDAELILAMIDGDADLLAIDKHGDTPLDVLLEHEHGRALDMVRRKYPQGIPEMAGRARGQRMTEGKHILKFCQSGSQSTPGEGDRSPP